MTEMNDHNENVKSGYKMHYSVWVLISFGFGQFMIVFLETVFNSRIYDFYENEIGLESEIILIAMILYAVWNMFNDPIIGFISDKPRKWWGRFGKRMPWMIGSGLPWAFFFMVLFLVPESWIPSTHRWLLFAWLLISICIYDTLFSIFDTNYNGLSPDKFRTNKMRLRQSGIANVLSLIAGILASILTPNLINYGDRTSFRKMSFFVSIFAFVSLLLCIPGIIENKAMRDRAITIDAVKTDDDKFFKKIAIAMKQRSFVAYIVIFLAFQCCSTLITASIPYMVRFIINESSDAEMYVMLGYVVTGVALIPIWMILARKLGNYKTFALCGALIAITTIPWLFLDTLPQAIITAAFMGIGLMGFGVILFPIMADVVDEASVRTKKRQGGFYMGLRIFFARISYIVQTITFTLVHIFTGFDEGSSTQTPLAIWGIRIQMAAVPIFLITIGVIIFWFLYDLTPKKKKEIQRQLKELNL